MPDLHLKLPEPGDRLLARFPRRVGSLPVLLFAVIGSGVTYVFAFWALGYFAASFIAVILIMFAFGNRNMLSILITALIAALIYQFVFMGLMDLFDPARKLVDFRARH